ncbi:RNA-directed DNA polymerase, eukaryota [Tanacetum coccineum]
MRSQVRKDFGKSRVKNETLNAQVSHYVYIMNFPPHFTVCDLRQTCEHVEVVNDVFVPNKLSQLGKPFSFVRFVKVGDVNILVKKLNDPIPKVPKTGGSTERVADTYAKPKFYADVLKGVKKMADKFQYLGAFWAAISVLNDQTCEKFKKHEGVGSWFKKIDKWKKDFEVKERVVWLDVEGILSYRV